MDPELVTTFTVGNLITFLGVVIAFLTLRSEHRKQRRLEREAQDRRHIQNLEALQAIRVEIATMKHLDQCMDELKTEVKELRQAMERKTEELYRMIVARDRE